MRPWALTAVAIGDVGSRGQLAASRGVPDSCAFHSKNEREMAPSYSYALERKVWAPNLLLQELGWGGLPEKARQTLTQVHKPNSHHLDGPQALKPKM